MTEGKNIFSNTLLTIPIESLVHGKMCAIPPIPCVVYSIYYIQQCEKTKNRSTTSYWIIGVDDSRF